MHNDLKPENILINSKLEVKIADLAFTTLINKKTYLQPVTTLWYMAPE